MRGTGDSWGHRIGLIVTDEELEVVVGDALAVIVDHMNYELLPTGSAGVAGTAFRVHLVEGGLTKLEGRGFPVVIGPGGGDAAEMGDEVANVWGGG